MLAASVRLLGPVELAVGGVPITVAGARQRAVLAALAVEGNRVVPTSEIIRAAWGDDADDHDHRLQQQISTLRKTLDPGRLNAGSDDVLATVSPGYRLRCDRTDIVDFEQAASDAAAARAARRIDDALVAFDRALSHWRGAALADVRVSPWFDAVATRLDERRLVVAQARIECLLESGRPADALAEVDALVVEHPFREGLRAQQMLALYRCDRQAEALAVYRSIRTLLVDELGIEPGSELRELESSVLRQDPRLRMSADVDASEPQPVDVASALAETFRAGPLERGHVFRPDGQIIVLLDGANVIGRQPDATVRLDDSRVSRRHARIDCDGDTYRVVDLGSTNGTTVNGEPASGQALADGDVIGIGTIELPFAIGSDRSA